MMIHPMYPSKSCFQFDRKSKWHLGIYFLYETPKITLFRKRIGGSLKILQLSTFGLKIGKR